jgi:hypothetical protein
MMLERDLGGVLDLGRRTAEHGAKARRRHGRGRPHLPLAADLGARDRGIVLDESADGRRGQQESRVPLAVRLRMEFLPVADDGRDHAGRAVGRRRDDAAARGILLVDRHGEDRQPVIGEQRVRAVGTPLLLQPVVNLACAPLHIEATGHDARLGQPALDAGIHDVPDAVEFGVEFGAGAVDLLIGALHLGDGVTAARRHLQHLAGAAEGIGHVGLPWPSGPRAFRRCNSSSETTKPPPTE